MRAERGLPAPLAQIFSLDAHLIDEAMAAFRLYERTLRGTNSCSVWIEPECPRQVISIVSVKVPVGLPVLSPTFLFPSSTLCFPPDLMSGLLVVHLNW